MAEGDSGGVVTMAGAPSVADKGCLIRVFC
jgi:hypothetical protein